MTEYTRRQLRTITSRALRKLADDRHAEAHDRSMALAALAELRSEPAPDLREPYVARFTVQPGVHLTVDASHNILLEVRTADEAELLAAYPLGDVVKLADTAANCPQHRAHRGRGRARGGPRGGEGLGQLAGGHKDAKGRGLVTLTRPFVMSG